MQPTSLHVMTNSNKDFWHHKLSHPSNNILSKFPLVFCFLVLAHISHCDSCLSNKSCWLPFGKNTIQCNSPFEVIYQMFGELPRLLHLINLDTMLSLSITTLNILGQAPRVWHHELRRTFLVPQNFVNSVSNSSLFIYCHNSTLIYVLVYVDDILVTGNNSCSIQNFINTLSFKDLGSLHYFLGMEVTPTSQGLFISQHKIHHWYIIQNNAWS